MNIGKRRVDAVAYIILGLGALLILFPMYITVVTTLKTMQESANSFFTLPTSFYLGNYKEVLANPTLGYSYRNTIYVTFASLFLEFLVMPPMAFAISRGMYHKSGLFKGLYIFFLLGIFLPFQVRMMPLMKLLAAFNMLHQTGLILLYLAHATCESMFLYPGEVVDGHGHDGDELYLVAVQSFFHITFAKALCIPPLSSRRSPRRRRR